MPGKRMIARVLSILPTGIGILDFVMLATTELISAPTVAAADENYMNGAKNTLAINIMPGPAHQCSGLKLSHRLCCLH